jgi:hypothetical protein
MPTVENLRYPTSTDTPDVPRDIGNLATDVAARTPYAYAVGQSITPAGGTLVVNFPAGRFTKAPTVVGSIVSAALPGSACALYVSGISATQFTLKTHSQAAPGGGALTVAWIAIQDDA